MLTRTRGATRSGSSLTAACVRVAGVRGSGGAAERRPNQTAGRGEEEDSERGDETASGGESSICTGDMQAIDEFN